MKCYYKYYRNIVYTVKNTTIYTNINCVNIFSSLFSQPTDEDPT